jgi:hypothetical protein
VADREHLFRDEGGAALERASHLEQENAALRAELAHERSQRQAQTPRTARPGRSTPAIALIGIGVGLVLLVGAAALVLVRVPAAPPIVVSVPASPEPSVSGDPVESSPMAFNRSAAAAALGAVDVQPCKPVGWSSGRGHVRVTFASSGKVSNVEIDGGMYAGTPPGGCIATLYRTAQVPPFVGGPVTVGQSFELP